VLNEIDGPMLKYGIQGFHNKELMILPSSRKDRPDRDLLATRYQSFLSAS